jgi:hypothetical protein
MTDEDAPLDIFRDNRVHVLADLCSSCIFKPHHRPVEGARVAELVRDTRDEAGATVPCHKTLYGQTEHNAICAGWWQRFAHRDPILGMAIAMDIVEFDPAP